MPLDCFCRGRPFGRGLGSKGVAFGHHAGAEDGEALFACHAATSSRKKSSVGTL